VKTDGDGKPLTRFQKFPQGQTNLPSFETIAKLTGGMNSRSGSFAELILQCRKCHQNGDTLEAVALIDHYLSDAQAEHSIERIWNIQQALGFRATFLSEAESPEAVAAEEKHLLFCTGQLRYWLSAAADSSANLALRQFRAGKIAEGHRAAKEAARLSGALGAISGTVARAAEEARKHLTK
jgi:hypothetical protein